MKKLEDIPKKNLFEVPEGYFDRLPGVIQARVAEPEKNVVATSFYRLAVRYALPAMIVVVAATLYLNRTKMESAEDMLASIDSQHLVAYLAETDLNTEELLEGASLDREDADAIQLNSMLEITGDDADIKGLVDELGADYF